MKFLDELIQLIDDSIKEDADSTITSWNIIKKGFDSEVDSYREIIDKSHVWLGEYQRKLIESTGLNSLKIKFTQNSGYFIEIPRSQAKNISDEFIHTQSLTQFSRYTSSDLQDFERKLELANSVLVEKEHTIFLHIRDVLVSHFDNIYNLSRKIAQLDYFTNAAYISLKRWYNTPQISWKYQLSILKAKHPVIAEKQNDFISNDLLLSSSDFVHVITGPNMWGKSTYLRQNALLILIAHMGYDIPCEKAEIGIVDKIFSRVWAGDNLYLWQSTFMVEMQEVSYILRNSTKRSFVIIDEVWRGTSTYDGMSLAWAILKHNHDEIGAKTLFATHYHEIIDHVDDLKWVSNYSIAVWENNENIVFLRKIIPGAIKKSYGIEVAKIAWIPESVLMMARNMIQHLESPQSFEQLSFLWESHIASSLSFQDIINELKNIDINNLSPLEAFKILLDIQDKIEKEEKNLNNKK